MTPSDKYRPPDKTAFGQALREARLRANTTQPKLAVAVGLESHSRISAYESGRFNELPASDFVFALEQALDCQPGELSRHLGFYPPGALTEAAVPDAIDTDPRLGDAGRRALLAMYRHYANEG